MKMKKRPARPADTALRTLREEGLAKFPGAHLKSPWPGHLDLAVKDKTFAYLSVEGQPFSISCKLPRSCDVALQLPFAAPTGYGLGKSGWVTATIPDGEPVPLDLFRAWIEESYRAQAPKRLIAELDGAPAERAPADQTAANKTAANKTAANKTAANKTAANKTAANKTPAKKAGTKKAAAKKTAAEEPSPEQR